MLIYEDRRPAYRVHFEKCLQYFNLVPRLQFHLRSTRKSRIWSGCLMPFIHYQFIRRDLFSPFQCARQKMKYTSTKSEFTENFNWGLFNKHLFRQTHTIVGYVMAWYYIQSTYLSTISPKVLIAFQVITLSWTSWKIHFFHLKILFPRCSKLNESLKEAYKTSHQN